MGSEIPAQPRNSVSNGLWGHYYSTCISLFCFTSIILYYILIITTTAIYDFIELNWSCVYCSGGPHHHSDEDEFVRPTNQLWSLFVSCTKGRFQQTQIIETMHLFEVHIVDLTFFMQQNGILSTFCVLRINCYMYHHVFGVDDSFWFNILLEMNTSSLTMLGFSFSHLSKRLHMRNYNLISCFQIVWILVSFSRELKFWERIHYHLEGVADVIVNKI